MRMANGLAQKMARVSVSITSILLDNFLINHSDYNQDYQLVSTSSQSDTEMSKKSYSIKNSIKINSAEIL